MSEDLVNIEVDGVAMQARKGAMIIEVTDAAHTYVPRFCYHKKLSVAANCRMCLVQVEKAPKPVPACATPVMEGMKVFTKSPLAREAQKATMEFLLINHPLDCPICDQGGECELQDLAMGYGADVSRYTEGKRVVKDKNIGPLIQTDMTRCIHCTRCVRFGEEVAGLKELGATGRGEHMEIGTYIAKAITSEMSGNVIDVCPVGALTSKPYRFSARAWELRQKDGVAPHDCIGSNIHLHVKGQVVKRVVPRENERVNEVWISDRDRYAYEGLNSKDRLTSPMIKEDGQWREVDWETALNFAAAGLSQAVHVHGPEQVGVLCWPSATLEEYFLLQKLMRSLGVHNIDHRLRQTDFSAQHDEALYPGLNLSVAEIEHLKAALLIGSDVRREQPLANHRLRKASLRGARLMAVNPVDFDFNWHVNEKLIVAPGAMVEALAGVARVLAEDAGDADRLAQLKQVSVGDNHRAIAENLKDAGNAAVLLGAYAISHPAFSTLRTLAAWIAEMSGARLGFLCEGANSAGAWLSGVVPHRGPAGTTFDRAGLDVRGMLEQPRRAYVLLGLEPEFDFADGVTAQSALQGAEFVLSLSAFRTPVLDDCASVMLPIALFAENAGTYINAAGDWQAFDAAVNPPGEARPAWKIVRVLGNTLEMTGFNYMHLDEIRAELHKLLGDQQAEVAGDIAKSIELPASRSSDGMERITEVPMYAVDPQVRRAAALQRTAEVADDILRVHPADAARLGLDDGAAVKVRQGTADCLMQVGHDPRLPAGTVLIRACGPGAVLGMSFGAVTLEKA
jgi:NADH-quinone oxidoreductase subunit G